MLNNHVTALLIDGRVRRRPLQQALPDQPGTARPLCRQTPLPWHARRDQLPPNLRRRTTRR
jgi:hypothetical protein